MGVLIALAFPPVSMLIHGRYISAAVCLLLQITVLGWIPAAIWAYLVRAESLADKRTDRIVRATRGRV